MDRWSIVSALNYLPHEVETKIVVSKVPKFNGSSTKETIEKMVSLAELTRNGFISGDLSTLMSPRTVITWGENTDIVNDLDLAFKLTFLNKCDELERPIVSEYYQRCFGRELIKNEITENEKIS